MNRYGSNFCNVFSATCVFYLFFVGSGKCGLLLPLGLQAPQYQTTWNQSQQSIHWVYELLADLDWDVLVLTRRLCGEHIGDLRVGRSLPTNGALDGTPPRAHTVLLHDDGDALVTEAVATCQHGPLERREETSVSRQRSTDVNKTHTGLLTTTLTSCPRGRAQMGHGSGFSPPVDLSWDWNKGI